MVDNNTELVYAKARETTQKLRAAGLAGLRSYLHNQPLHSQPLYGQPEPFRLKESKSELPQIYVSPEVSAPRSRLTSSGTHTNKIKRHSTPTKYKEDHSLSPSHRSVDSLDDSNVKQELSENTIWTSPSLTSYINKPRLEHQSAPAPYASFPRSAPALQPPDKRASQPFSSTKKSHMATIFQVICTCILFLLAVCITSLLLVYMSNRKIMNSFIGLYGAGNASPWMRQYNPDILRELDLASAQKAQTT